MTTVNTVRCNLLYGTNLSWVGIFVPAARPPRARAGSLQRSHWPRTASRARRRAFRRARFTGLRGARWRGFSPRVCEHAVGCARRRLSAGVNSRAIAIAFANQPGPAGAHASAQHGALNSPISRAQRGRERVATPTGTTGETTGAQTATRLTRVRGASGALSETDTRPAPPARARGAPPHSEPSTRKLVPRWRAGGRAPG